MLKWNTRRQMIDIPFIRIDKDVFDNAEYDELVLLLGLLHFDPEKKGVFKAKFYVNADLTNSQNYIKLNNTYKELLDLYFEEQVSFTTKYRVVSKQNQPKNQFTLLEAIRFFQTPISVVLENSLNDGYFMKAIFRYFDKSGILLTYYNYGWLNFDNAGGWKNIENFVKGKIVAYVNYSKKLKTEPIKYIRCFVMMDSDKTSKDTPLETKKESLKEFLEKYNSKVHILNKRAMENYLPDSAVLNLNIHNYREQEREMQQWKKNLQTQTWIIACLALSNEEKDYKDFSELGMPFDKREMPKFFGYNDYTDKQGLLDREGGTADENEFLEIITKIGSLL
jgi:hypothetical protein